MALWDGVVRRFPLRAITALLLGLSLCACGNTQSPGLFAGTEDAPRQTAVVVTLEEALQQLEELALPAGADPLRFEEFKAELQAALIGTGLNRFSSAAPDSPASVVSNLSVLSEGGPQLTFGWDYRSQGDYDMNSEVNIADLTPIGQHFRKTPASADWATARTADGDNNTEVNIADITPIGSNFQRKVDGYQLQESTTGEPEGAWTTVTQVLFSESTLTIAEGRRAFTAIHTPTQGGFFYRVVPFHGSDPGVPSNIVQAPVNSIPGRPENFTATQGTLFNAVELNWEALDGVEGYEVMRRVNIADQFAPIDTLDSATLTYTDTTVVTGTHYQYVVRGFAGELFSSNSVIAEGWPLEVPFAPENLAATDGASPDFIELSWDPAAFVDEYIIFRSTTQGSGYAQIATSATNSYQDTSATTDSYFFYVVRSSNQAGSSGESNEDRGHLDGTLPEITSVTPLSGLRGLDATFSAVSEGAPVVSWEWDFAGATVPPTSTEESPTVTFTALGVFDCSVTATGTVDSVTFNFQLLVEDSQWTHSFGQLSDDSCGSVGVDATGNVYATGRLQYDPLFTKWSPDGNLLYSKMFDTSRSQLGINAVTDPDGNTYACAIPVPPNNGLLLVKLDSSGALVWQKLWTSTQGHTHPRSALDSAGNYYCSATNSASGAEDIVVLKINPAGLLQWQKLMTHGGALGHDSIGNDGFHVDGAGNVYIAGDEGRILKMDTNGNLIWEKEWGTASHDHTYAIAVDADSNVYLGGGTESGGDPYRSYVVKLNPDGGLIWQNWYLMDNGPVNSPDYSFFRLDAAGNLYALTTDDTGMLVGPQLVRYDLDGNVTGHWSLKQQGTGVPSLFGIALDSSGYLYLSGTAPNNMLTWQAETGTTGTLGGTVSDSENNMLDGSGLYSDFPGGMLDVVVTVDTGAGGSDGAVIKLGPESLPQT